MSKIKNWTIIVLTVFVLMSALQAYRMHGKWQREKAAHERLWVNFVEMGRANKHLIVSQQEWRRHMSREYDSVLALLRVKPKEVVRYEERIITQVEVDTVYVPVKEIAPLTWQISDVGPCFVWSGVAHLPDIDSALEVKRTGFVYENEVVDVLTKRVKWKFLFIRKYEKDRFDIHSTAKCGGVQTKIIEVEK